LPLSFDNEDDAVLLRRLTDGDESAFLALYRRRRGPVFSFALRMSGSRQVAEEVTQDTFVMLLKESHGYDGERGTVASYLFGIARNLVFRRLRERTFVPLDGDEGPEDSRPSALDGLTREEDIARVRRAIGSLPPAYREVVVLCELEDMPYAEAAARIGCPIGTVRSRLARARALLAAKLRGEPVRHGTVRAVAVERCWS
jgi:RNA polymerase sigma-70 factor (ECF subfamily)